MLSRSKFTVYSDTCLTSIVTTRSLGTGQDLFQNNCNKKYETKTCARRKNKTLF